jgi:four helix bundle protein
MKKSELEDRLVKFSVSIIGMTKELEDCFAAQHLSKQIIRSASSSALNYGEAQGAPTKKDFIHKISIVLRELRETQINLKIIEESGLMKDQTYLSKVVDENSQLVAIFTKTFQTARQNEKDA